jgi:transposase-like protein
MPNSARCARNALTSIVRCRTTDPGRDARHLDEAVIVIGGAKYWLWRAIDGDGDVLDNLIQSRRNAKAARRFLGALAAQYGEPRVVVSDKLHSDTKPVRALLRMPIIALTRG